MNNYDQQEDDFAQWVDMWDQAQKTNDFKKETGVSVPASQRGFDSNNTPQDFYWNNLGEDEMLTEEKSPNPVYPDSVGKDQDQPKAAWVKEDLVEEISDLKRKLYDIEVELNKADGGGGKWVEKCHETTDKYSSEINSLKEKIDNLSNKLGLDSETPFSQWETGNTRNKDRK